MVWAFRQVLGSKSQVPTQLMMCIRLGVTGGMSSLNHSSSSLSGTGDDQLHVSLVGPGVGFPGPAWGHGIMPVPGPLPVRVTVAAAAAAAESRDARPGEATMQEK
jgi:hypothetical protein